MGRRGEGWVAVQLLLMAAIAIAPRRGGAPFPEWLRWGGLLALVGGGLLLAAAILRLGRNLTPFPKPIEGGEIVQQGPYGLVRHPIYSSILLGGLGWALWRSSPLGLALALLLFAFFDAKSRQEERWLVEQHPDYAHYQRAVRGRLLPRIY